MTRDSASASKAAAATTSEGSSAANGSELAVAQLLGHLAADEDGVCAAAEVLEDAELVLDLGPARDEDERPLDVAEQPSEHLELLLEQEPRVGGKQLGHAHRGRMGAVGRAEGVIHVQVPALGKAPRALRVVPRLARVEARVLEHPHAVVRQELAQARRDRCHPERGIGALRAAEVRAHGDPGGPLVEEVAQRRQRGPDPRVVGDAAVLERDVQVRADQDVLARDLRLADGTRLPHCSPRTWKSSNRFPSGSRR